MPNFTPSDRLKGDSSLQNYIHHQLRNEHPSAIRSRNSSISNLGTTSHVFVNIEETTQISLSLNNERSRIQNLLQLGDSIRESIEGTSELPLSPLPPANAEAPTYPIILIGPPDPDDSYNFDLILKELQIETIGARVCRFYFTGGREPGLSVKSSNLLLAHAIANHMHNAVARSIATYNADVNARHDELTPLMLTAHYQNASAAKLLLTPALLGWTLDNDFGSFDNQHDFNLYHSGMFYLARLDVNQRDSNGFSASMMWLEKGNTEIAELLISRGADVSKDLEVAAHGKHTKVLTGLVELLRKNDPGNLLSLNTWIEKSDFAMATALYPYVGITKANLDEAAGNFQLSTLLFFTNLLKEKSILAIDYLRAKHPFVAEFLQFQTMNSNWHTLEVIKSSMEHSPDGRAGRAPAEVRSHVDQLSPEVIQSIQNFEIHKDFERLGAMRKSLVSFAQQEANPQPSVAIQQAWEKI